MLGANRRVSGPSGLLSSSSCIPLCTFHMMTEFPLSSFVIAILSIPSRGLTLSRGLVNTGHERISACLVRGCESQALPLYPTLYQRKRIVPFLLPIRSENVETAFNTPFLPEELTQSCGPASSHEIELLGPSNGIYCTSVGGRGKRNLYEVGIRESQPYQLL